MTATIGVPQDVARVPERVGAVLQEALVDLIALGLDGKQAHWHIYGPQFLPVHEQLDRIVDDARSWGDLVAERSVTLGVPVDGRAVTVAADAGTAEFPTGFVDDGKAVALVRDRLEAVVTRLRSSVDGLGDLDPVTQDLVIEVLRGLEKHLWMLQAQTKGVHATTPAQVLPEVSSATQRTPHVTASSGGRSRSRRPGMEPLVGLAASLRAPMRY